VHVGGGDGEAAGFLGEEAARDDELAEGVIAATVFDGLAGLAGGDVVLQDALVALNRARGGRGEAPAQNGKGIGGGMFVEDEGGTSVELIDAVFALNVDDSGFSNIPFGSIDSGREVRRLQGHQNYVVEVNFSPDGKWIVTGAWDNTARLCDAESGRLVHTLVGHGHRVEGARFSADSQRIVTGSLDGAIRVWDVATGGEVHRFDGHPRPVTKVSFLPDRNYVVSGSWDGTARLWRLPPDK
jgi:hypothetical protein